MAIVIYSDASVNGNNLGTYGTMVVYKNDKGEVVNEAKLTNSDIVVKQEQTALAGIISGIKFVNTIDNGGTDVTVICTNKYICDAINLGLIYEWIRAGWSVHNREIPNRGLWLQLLNLIGNRKCEFKLISQLRQDRLSKLDYQYLTTCRKISRGEKERERANVKQAKQKVKKTNAYSV